LLAVDPDGGQSVGVARYVRDHERRDSAEIAVSVLEPWQGRGVGQALLHRLAHRARDEGITHPSRCASNRRVRAEKPVMLGKISARSSGEPLRRNGPRNANRSGNREGSSPGATVLKNASSWARFQHGHLASRSAGSSHEANTPAPLRSVAGYCAGPPRDQEGFWMIA
jgi:hypothetical protein